MSRIQVVDFSKLEILSLSEPVELELDELALTELEDREEFHHLDYCGCSNSSAHPRPRPYNKCG